MTKKKKKVYKKARYSLIRQKTRERILNSRLDIMIEEARERDRKKEQNNELPIRNI